MAWLPTTEVGRIGSVDASFTVTARLPYPAAPRRPAPGPRASTLSLADDVGLHRSQQGQELALFLFTDLVLVESLDERLHRGVPLGVRDPHALVNRFHVPAEVAARAAGRFADLVGEVGLELLDLRRLERLEALIDAIVLDHVGHEVSNHVGDR